MAREVDIIVAEWRAAEDHEAGRERLSVLHEMLAAGVSPKDAADVLGHANPTMTLNVYAHSTAERQRAAMEAIGQALG